LQLLVADHMSLSPELVHLLITEFSLLMRRQNVQQVFSIRYDNLWNPAQSQLHEALEI
jgi:hypothetical protein